MATAQEVAEFKSALAGISALSEAEVVKLWNTLNPDDAVRTSAVLQQYLPELVFTYGEMSAAVASDFYETLREGSKVRRVYRTVMSEAPPKEAIQINVRYNLKPLFSRENADPEQALSNLNLMTDKAVKAAGRDTISLNVERDPVQARFARVPTGAQTCKFCLMLASRGAVYTSQKTAGSDYHGHCDCQPVPVWSEEDLPPGYDPDALYEEYKRLK